MFSHSLRKVACVIGRKEMHQIAYVTRDGTDGKLCHIFQTDSFFEVEEIETILSNAFQRNASNISLNATPIGKTPFSYSCAHLKPSIQRSKREHISQPGRTTSNSALKNPLITPTTTTTKSCFRLGFSGSKSRKQLTQSGRSAAFFHRLFGSATNSTIEKRKPETGDTTPIKWRNTETDQEKSKRRPVSAVIGHSVLQRFSTAAGIKNSKSPSRRKIDLVNFLKKDIKLKKKNIKS